MRNLTKVGVTLAIVGIVAIVARVAISRAGGGASGSEWTQVGPAPIAIDAGPNNPTKFQGKGPISGQVQDIAIDPRNGNDRTMYIATQDGGIWKSTDGGSTWKPKTDFLNSLSAGAVALEAGNPSIVYYGTGELVQQGFFKAVGLYKSTDGGDTWTLLNPSNVFTPANGGLCVDNLRNNGGITGFNGPAIIRIVSPSPNTVVVATSYGLFQSTDGGAHFASVLANGSCVSDLELDTTTANTVFAAVDGNFGNNGNIDPTKNNGESGIFKSIDGGATWSNNLLTSGNGAPTTNLAWITFSQSKKTSNNTIYFTSSDYRTPLNAAGNPNYPFLGLFKTSNLGTNWAQVTSDIPGAGCQCGYDQAIAVDPTDAAANTLYIGFQHIFKSTNGGTNFTDLTPGTTANQVHNDHHVFLFSPSSHSPTKLYDGSDGGIALTPDGGTTFFNINGTIDPNNGLANGATQGIATNLFRGIDIGRGSPTNNQYSYGGMQDTGTAEFAPGFSNQTWKMGIDGDGSPPLVDPTQPMTVFGVDDGSYMVSNDAGHTWSFPPASTTNLPCSSGTGSCGQPVAIDFNNHNNVYVTNGAQLFRSTDNGATFTSIKTFAQGITSVSSQVAIDSNVLYVGLADGTVQVTSNALAGSPTFAATTGTPNHLASQGVASIAIDPSNTQIAVVTYNGFCGSGGGCASNNQHVFRTIDGGINWGDITGTPGGGFNNLPDLPVHTVAIDPNTSPHTIIIGNDAGVLQTADNGQTWQVLGLGMPTVDVVTVALDASASPELLRAGTYGRSTFELKPATTGLLAVNSNLNFGSVCKGASYSANVELMNVGSQDLHISSFTRQSGSPDFAITSGPSTPVTIPAGEHIDFTITFTPSTPNTTESAVFQIDSDDPNTPMLQLAASGTVGSGKIKLTGNTSFGDTCAGSAQQGITVANVGTCDLHVTSATTCSDFTIQNNPFPATISHDFSLPLSIAFTPTTPGPKNCNLTVSSDDPNTPNATLPLGANAPAANLNIPASLAFPPTVVRSLGACTSKLPFPISNDGKCPVTIDSVVVGGANAADYSLLGLPSTPITIEAGHILGEGDLNAVFSPLTPLSRTDLGSITVTYHDATTSSTIAPASPMCGEGTNTGIRVLVTVGGVPTAQVYKMVLSGLAVPNPSAGGVDDSPMVKGKKAKKPPKPKKLKYKTLDTQYYLNLQTVPAGPAPCPQIQYHREYGTVSNPIQLQTGSYQLVVTIVNPQGHVVNQTINFNLNTCDFNKNILVQY